MTHNRKIASKLTIGFFGFFIFLFVGGNIHAQNAANGETLFKANCTSCHAMETQLTGPALMGAYSRWKDPKKLHLWIKHNPALLAAKDPYATSLYAQYKSSMTDFNSILSDADVDDIIAYIKGYTPKAPAAPIPGSTTGEPESDNTLLYGILTLILAVVAFVLLQVNANLKKLADDKDGIPAQEPVPFWKNKAYIAFVIVILFLVSGYMTVSGAMGLGRTQNFQPKQPIFYSHKVHAGINQINCMYCHIGTYQGKQATVPSVNICMNCHMAIKEYKGAQLYTAEGEEVNGTAEIQKLYKYANYTPGQVWDAKTAKPIEWIRIHNLPDHVYFNHSQHVVAGKVQCQTCHGEIQNMDEVKQFAPLSMGWCINCHRTTKVNFKDNGFYSIYEKFQDRLKNNPTDSITVEDIGGTECQKCHY
ncbi:MAG TPA: c-type cytochrome [Chitinophagaceae bacterium]|nr:c-type cytochrome [Chitinophagaceae bacterium]